MFSKFLILAFAASPLVAAHGKVTVVTGNAGGNTTALGILGGIVPGAGPTSKTEVDTTIFRQFNPASNGLGKTPGGGQNTFNLVSKVINLSGNTFPQVSDKGGSLHGLLHIVTPDGAGPYTAIIDPTGTGEFAKGIEADVSQQVPGNNGQVHPSGKAPKSRRWADVLRRMGVVRRASEVDKDFPFTIQVPAGTTCHGTIAKKSNVCLVKFVNPSRAGPFGGVFAMQIAAKKVKE